MRPTLGSVFESVPDDLYDDLAAFAGTHGRLDELPGLHASDWDLLVSFADTPTVPQGVHLLSFGGEEFVHIFSSVWGGSGYHLYSRTESIARHVRVADEAPPEWRSLIQRTVVDTSPGVPRRVFNGYWSAANRPLAVVGAEAVIFAFLTESRAEGAQAFTLGLPDSATGHVDWLVAFSKFLHETDPERFPGAPDWQSQAEWGTPEIRRAAATLDGLADERTEVMTALAKREAQAARVLESAVRAGADGAQRALTRDGDELVDAVAGLLRDLGFVVDEMDEHHDQKTGAKLEDLRATDPDVPGWVALVEVKGYTRGAKVNDVAQIIGRPSMAFAIDQRRPPDAVWHIVNTWRETDPSTRPIAIPNDNDLSALTSAGGTLIDTRDLFTAWRAVHEGTATSTDVRGSLREALTRWTNKQRA